jgi:hypothetical protein
MFSGCGIRPIHDKDYLVYGNVGHAALHLLYRGLKLKDVLEFIGKAYYAEKRKGRKSPDELQKLEVDQAALSGTISAYAKIYRREIKRGKPLRFWTSENKFSFVVKLASGPVTIAGSMDMIAKSKKRTYVIEDKFPGYLAKDVLDEYKCSIQTLIYLIGYYECLAKPRERVGIFYRYTRKPSIRQRKNESRRNYIIRVYNEFSSRPEHYFHRERVKMTPAKILLYKQELVNTLNAMAAVKTGHWWYKNRKACLAKGRCFFFDPCHNGQSPQVMAAFKKKDHKHTELEMI